MPSNMMDESSATANRLQQSPSYQNISETTVYSIDSDMSKRHNNHYNNYDKSNTNECWCLFRCPKISVIALRRSWNLKFLILMVVALVCAICYYSDSFLYGPVDNMKIPRVAIELKRDDLNLEIQQEQQSETGEGVTKRGPKGERRFPASIIFGVSKCGTRAVLEYLKLHPDVVAPMAEVNFFDNETLFHKGAKWYLQQMPYARDNQIIVEKSPDYFQNPECAPMIRRMNSTIKLLLLLRDPVERLVSQYMQLLDKNPSLPKFEEWVLHPTSGNINTNIRSVMVSAYAKYLETWLSVFDKDQILIIESDDLRKNPLTEMKRVESFLRLKPYFQKSDFYFNDTRGFHCVQYRSNGRTKCLGKSKGRQHIAVEENVLKQLQTFYEPYNKKLNDMLGVKFPWS